MIIPVPVVSVICLCYNHERFLAEALDSVLAQTYPNIEIIILDDASTDNSVAIIQEYCRRFPHLQFIQNSSNLGSCRAFNRAFKQSTGKYIIDFATDDVLLPNRITEQVQCFADLPEDYGVVYTNAILINEASQPIRPFYQILPNGKRYLEPVSGWIYEFLVRKYFISTPTMLIKRTVLEKLNGYNEELVYEDFDFWVRSSRYFQYYFLDKILTKRRLHPQQQSRQLYKKQDKQLASTVLVCQTALQLNRTTQENAALTFRVKYEFRKAVSTCNFKEALALAQLLQQLQSLNGVYKLAAILIQWQQKLF
ncbi:glycosyltransferase family 2 protein [Adhaeribacter pallidiroseus]|uniref:Glucuronosyl-N-acetylgalactosaminyl-proteoglycan 4-beta-N-acetylgalactosaminyltransferase n=1 Tax=Adhaeribacter pallidiroseus TaxID=2072847 RepID=A0A369QGJ5_9BACT|nr:glycosyltransferase [Adhaeribacter pallidiroseus]RDC63532.1 Glucuronosyl-N-acetylgalactosaminyl-proteoglycan 4-beta-N-acetylgalactosaminyltransferase [Adhaeribacter pallidiroseus]